MTEQKLLEEFKHLKPMQIYGKLRKFSKICSKCSSEKSLLSFYNYDQNTISNLCKSCYNQNTKLEIYELLKSDFMEKIDKI